jgi:hypothetical protein
MSPSPLKEQMIPIAHRSFTAIFLQIHHIVDLSFGMGLQDHHTTDGMGSAQRLKLRPFLKLGE